MGDDEDPDKIVSLGMEEVPLDEEEKGQDPIYRACSVTDDGRSQLQEMFWNVTESTTALRRQMVQGSSQKQAEATSYSWSITKLFRNRRLFRFKCCEKADDDEISQPGIELESLYATQKEDGPYNVDEVDGNEVSEENLVVPKVVNVMPAVVPIACSIGPVMTVDCSNLSVDVELQRMKAPLGDVICKLVIKNSPIMSARRILEEPLVNENVTSVHIQNCDLTVRDICLILGNLKLIEQLSIEIKAVEGSDSSLLKEDFHKSQGCKDKEYFRNQRNQLFSSMDSAPQRLKVLTLSLPMIWQCSLICQTVGVFSDKSYLEEINIKSSLKNMIVYLVSTDNVHVEDEATWQNLVTLDARDLIQKSSSSLKHLSIACADTFPMEYLSITKTLGIPVDVVFKWCFWCTCGILSSIATFNEGIDVKSGHLLLPELKNLSLNLPMIPIPMARGDDDLRKPLNAVAEFIAKNYFVHVVSLHGLRPVKGMENWIKNSLVTIPKYRMSIGVTYTSTTLNCNLPIFDDELGSLGLEIVADEPRANVKDIIDPHGMEVIPLSWRYGGLKFFHLINQSPSLVSYDMERIASKFSKLTKLTIEDYAFNYGSKSKEDDGDMTIITKSLGDTDIQTIFEKLICLEYLHLDCNMKNVTDGGLTGMKDSFWRRFTQREKMFSFWYLYNLKHIFLRGLGDQVTDKSAIYPFSEEYSLKKLVELRLFAPGFTNYGREKIRRAYEGRNGFILQLL